MPRTASRLKTYRDKRDFGKTLEPKATAARGNKWRFAVQRHVARRLHFDLRLELDGVLKSWAVTKGPSLVKGTRRLAVETEDHPLEYLNWEGVIPKGEYGGGTMIVWDKGTWAPECDPCAALDKGKLDFTLAGERLKGRFHLVRMAKRAGKRKDQWLLVKGSDEYAIGTSEVEPSESELTSVLSGRTNADLEEKDAIRPDHTGRQKARKGRGAIAPSALKLHGAKKTILPVFVEPALATLGQSVPKGQQWLHEIKYDGYRIQARLDGGKVKLLTRKGIDWTKRFAPIARALARLKVGTALLDGEIVVLGENGVSNFTDLQSDLKSGRLDRLRYFVFDILYYEGVSLKRVALLERKQVLHSLISTSDPGAPVSYSEHLEGTSTGVLQTACRMGLEGIVSKMAAEPYASGRSQTWIKAKCVLREEFAVAGYTISSVSKSAIGSLVLACHDGGKLVPAGRVGTGFSDAMARALKAELERNRIMNPPFGARLDQKALSGVLWVKSSLVVEIEHRGWTADGLLRQAAFKGIREDKDLGDVQVKKPNHERTRTERQATEKAELTHPDRLLWPDAGITKQGLAEFYEGIADWILPHVKDRVLSTVRCPGGAGPSCFYAKHLWKGAERSLKPIDLGEAEPMFYISDMRGLLSLVQSNVLEIHPWGSRIRNVEKPDRIIFDLDPGSSVNWTDVIAAAIEVRSRLRDAGLESFVKTSGGKGLHVVAPIRPKLDWDSVKAFSKTIAAAMAADTPQKFLAVATKSRRKGRIFVDYLRNARGATAVAAYSARARPGAPVSVPLTWSELYTVVGPDWFRIDNLRQRLDFLRDDPWAGFFDNRQELRIKAK